MNSFISWIGGKNNLKKEIVRRFPERYNRYVEVFGGAAWVLFYKDKHAEMEIYNDYNSDLVNLFKCVKYHRPELQRELLLMLNSRQWFEECKAQYNVIGMTDIQRAARFFMIIKTSYGSNQKNFGCVKKDISVIADCLTKIETRLAKVVIENKDFEGLIKIYDKEDALIYLDPPYFGTEKYYQAQFATQDHQRLRSVLENVKGKFLLSYNDCEYIRELYKDFRVEEIKRLHNLRVRYDNQDKIYNELIIKNY